MDAIVMTRGIAVAGLILGAIGILVRIRDIMNRPFKQDFARQRGDPRRGVLYAFTLGMAPWEKESTRLHWIAYLRGIAFHVGVFLGFAVLLVSPWLQLLPPWLKWPAAALTGLGSLLGFAGIFIRLTGPNERLLSLPDDYASVFLVSLFALLAAAVLLWPAVLPVFYLVAGVMAAYIPLSKIRHCVYFFYSKFFFGFGFGRRGVVGQARGQYGE